MKKNTTVLGQWNLLYCFVGDTVTGNSVKPSHPSTTIQLEIDTGSWKLGSHCSPCYIGHGSYLCISQLQFGDCILLAISLFSCVRDINRINESFANSILTYV